MNKILIISIIVMLFAMPILAKPAMIRIQGGEMTFDDGYYEPIRISLDSFELGKYEVTLGEFREFVEDARYIPTSEADGFLFNNVESYWDEREGYNWEDPGFDIEDDHPVGGLSWYDAISYCNWLSKKEGLTPVYTISETESDPNNYNEYDRYQWKVTWNEKANGYRLPTTFEWEYAARERGKDMEYPWGNKLFYDVEDMDLIGNVADENFAEYYEFNDNDLENYFWDYDDGYPFTAPVGSYQPNALGLYDMAGNVSELCWDWHDNDYMPDDGTRNPKGPQSGSMHAQRGGSWCDIPFELKISSRRDLGEENLCYVYIGMRLARNAK